MLMKEGDFIKIDFTARVAETGKVFDTTLADVARRNALDLKEAKAVGVVVGEGFVLKGLDKALLEHKVGDEFKLFLEPVDAFGKRNARLIKLMHLTEFKKRGIIPYPGLTLNIDNLIGTVRTVSGGRVIVDFNHPLAGKKLEYDVKIVEQVSKREDKARIITDFYGIPDCEFEFLKTKIKIKTKMHVPKQLSEVVEKLMKKHLNIDKIEFIENTKLEEGAKHG